MGLQLRWLEHTPDKRKVSGSILLRPFKLLYFIYLNRDYLESRFLYLTINRGIATGVFTQTMKNNPRLTYTVVGTTAVFSLNI